MEYPTHEEFAAHFGEYEELPEAPAEATEPNAPADFAEPTAPSEQGTEPAAEAHPAETATPTQQAAGNTEPASPPTAQQSAEERHRQAAARRAREQQQQEEDRQKAVDAVYAELLGGQINPFTGKPITTQAEYRAYVQMKDQQANTAALQKAGIDPQVIQQMVQQQLAPMQQQMQAAQAREAQAVAANYNRETDAMIAAAVKEIAAKYDPSIKSISDIEAMPTAQRFLELAQKGNTLEDAFYLANREEIDKRRAQAAYRRGVEQSANRQHLSHTPAASGGEPVKVPADVARMYREVTPGMTDAEIAADYAAYLKTLK